MILMVLIYRDKVARLVEELVSPEVAASPKSTAQLSDANQSQRKIAPTAVTS